MHKSDNLRKVMGLKRGVYLQHQSSIKKRTFKKTVMKKSLFTLLLVAVATVSFANVSLVKSTGIFENVLTEDPTFVRKGEKLVISFLNADLEPVEIRITDSKNNLVFAQEFDGDFIVQKAFDFSKAQRDDYKVVVAYKSIAVGQIVEVQ